VYKEKGGDRWREEKSWEMEVREEKSWEMEVYELHNYFFLTGA
jgi:hypothetical protein